MTSRLSLAATCLVATLVFAPTAHAQAVGSDYGAHIQTTLPFNELLVGQVQDAIPSEDVDVLAEQARLTVGVGEDLVDNLTQALILAPDDASRSRIEGVLTHSQAALASLRMVQQETTLDTARGRLQQARGEAQEALDELRPFVLSLFASGVIAGK
jgi:hypothetical protein